MGKADIAANIISLKNLVMLAVALDAQRKNLVYFSPQGNTKALMNCCLKIRQEPQNEGSETFTDCLRLTGNI